MGAGPEPITVPCSLRLTPAGWECWSCGQPAPEMPELPAAVVEYGQTFLYPGVPIRHLKGCRQVSTAVYPGHVMDVRERQEGSCPDT